MNSFLKVYYRQDQEALNGLGLPEELLDALVAHWSGNFSVSIAKYDSINFKSLAPDIGALAYADSCLLRAKRGEQFPATPAPILLTSRAACAVYEYARYTWSFWVDHRIALRASVRLCVLAPFCGIPKLWITSLFLLGHLLSIRGNRYSGYFLAKAAVIFSRTLLSVDQRSPLVTNVILAAYPYTLLMLGRVITEFPEAVLEGERLLRSDPYYLGIFQVSALYCYAYTGDIARTEIYAERMRKLHSEGKLLRYLPISAIMPLLPLALRGYGHLTKLNLENLLRKHDETKSDPLINSQFYRTGAVISLFLGNNKQACTLIQKAIEHRLQTRSFAVWNRFDKKVLSYAHSNRPFDPSKDSLTIARTQFNVPGNLGSFLSELNLYAAEAGDKNTDWLEGKISQALIAHVDETGTLQELDSSGDISAPMIRIGKVLLTFNGLTEERSGYLKELLSSLSPAVSFSLQTFDRLQQLRASEKNAAIGLMASQVAHDIRSPLAALDVVLSNSDTLPEENRIMARAAITRIKDIANNLISKTKPEHQQSQNVNTMVAKNLKIPTIELLSSLIETLITEKRLQYRSLLNVTIDYQADQRSYGLFALLDATEFARVLSNLINNAVEALPQQLGRVDIELFGEGDEVVLEIRDSGKGIPKHLIPLLGKAGNSFGKEDTESGSGLGLYHAKNSIASMAGNLEIESREGEGTRIQIRLPKKPAPSWFISKLEISSKTTVVIVDDDSTIHQIWDGRFKPILATASMEVLHFSIPDDVISCADSRNDESNTLYLVDYEFIGQKMNGLDLINILMAKSKAVLVTSRFEEPLIRGQAEHLGIKLIPKSMAGLVPISIISPTSKVDAILIDDDPLIRQIWKIAAKKAKMEIICLENFENFKSHSPPFPSTTQIYIDSSLGDGNRGEDHIPELKALGYKDIFLTTGYESTKFSNYPGLKVMGKDPPDWTATPPMAN